MTLRTSTLGGSVAVLLVLASPATGQLTSEDCLTCHQETGLTREDGRALAAIDQAAYAASVHGGFDCVMCHVELTDAELPHPATLTPVGCAMCHDEAVTLYERSIHAEARNGHPTSPAATCADCHGMHDIKPSADQTSRTYHLNLPDTCGHCHGNPEIIERGHIAIGDVSTLYADSIHGRALTRSGLVVAPNCADCHGSHDILRESNPQSRVHRPNVPATCGRCHEGVKREFEVSVHGGRVASGNPTAPACHDCHSAHAIQRAETESWRLDVIRECGTCHIESIRTYRDTFHGQVTALGFTRVATCSDCHTPHSIYPTSDERSSVGSVKLVGTCQRCHARANENFVLYDPHADKENLARNPFLYYTGKFMQSLLFFVFGFFGLHTGLWFVREFRHRREQAARRQADTADA